MGGTWIAPGHNRGSLVTLVNVAADDGLRRLQALRSRGLVTGWLVDLRTNGEVELVANHPREPETAIRITTRTTERGRKGVTATLTFADVRNPSAYAAARGKQIPPPRAPRTRPTPLKSAAALLDTPTGPALPDTGCACCGQVSPPEAGLDLTCTGLCWGCAQWHADRARVLCDPRCPHHLHPVRGDKSAEGWRDDPRAALGDPALVQMWLRDQGYHAICRSAGRWDAYTMAQDPRSYSDEVVCNTRTGAWTLRDVRGQEAPLAHTPVRHELRTLLIALRAGERAEAVASRLPALAG